ncbi:hypothetical protein HF086_006232 [Spodoptera exigua]|uniref:Uncharacterized protein n=1 Tax=Spodoptera exigua TaxID=7107 RepID=A0A922SLS6_SPOEX|nr:hypothetical protein HF086_006232 [Spodoptera exigua]
MITPPNEHYKDINSKTILPAFTKHHIQAFAEVYKKKTKNAWQMYESRHLLTARAVRAGDFTYIKCQCMASMKKISYVVDIKLRNACGSIEETHCECAVGSGHEA